MTSPLARGEAMQEVENIVRFMEMLKAIGGDQLMGFEMDLEKVTPRLGDLMNVPMDLRTTKEQKAKLKEAAAAQGAAAQGADPAVAAQAVQEQEAQEAQRNGRR